ncbi:MAG: hypothetical protein IJQ23_06615, partial [Clostridia bacterium]|nr:hypothetical protein [Clostridia bacterium]
MKNLKKILISALLFWFLFTIMTSSMYVYDACTKNNENYYKQICVKEVLSNYDINNGVDSEDFVWGYVITEMTIFMEEVGEFQRCYIIKVYREPYEDEDGQFAIDYY